MVRSLVRLVRLPAPLGRPALVARLAGFFVLAAVSAGCAPQIGDDCETSVDCSQGGERLCDITQPGGYCTVFNCEPDSCPEEAVCVAFGAQPSVLPECAVGDDLSRFARSFCMASCSSNADCRSGYACLDVGAPGNPWAAVVVDADESPKVCIPPPTTAPLPEDRSTDVCNATPAASSSAEPPGG